MNAIGSTKFRWAIIGTGQIAHQFAEDLAFVKTAELMAVCSRTQENASRFAQEFQISSSFSDVSEMLETAEIDVVYIATPNSSHYQLAHQCLELGKPVLVEKPLTSHSQEAIELQTSADQKGLFVMEALWTRFLPAIQFTKQALENELIGPIKQVHCELAFPSGLEPSDSRFDPETGGGLRDLGVYGLSLADYFFGSPIHVQGQWKAGGSGCDVSAEVKLRYLDFELDLFAGLLQNRANLFTIFGEKGTLVLQPPFNGCDMVLHFRHNVFTQWGVQTDMGFSARFFRKLLRTIPLPFIDRHYFPYSGKGLHFQVAEVHKKLSAGDRMHPNMPISKSIETLSIIENVLSEPPSSNL